MAKTCFLAEEAFEHSNILKEHKTFVLVFSINLRQITD